MQMRDIKRATAYSGPGHSGKGIARDSRIKKGHLHETLGQGCSRRGGGLKGGGGGLAGTPLLLGCPSTFSTFMMSCAKMVKNFCPLCVGSCQALWRQCQELNQPQSN